MGYQFSHLIFHEHIQILQILIDLFRKKCTLT